MKRDKHSFFRCVRHWVMMNLLEIRAFECECNYKRDSVVTRHASEQWQMAKAVSQLHYDWSNFRFITNLSRVIGRWMSRQEHGD